MGLKIGLDIDGVVADSFQVFRRELNKYYGKDVMEIYDYDISKVYGVAWDEMGKFFDANMEYLFSVPLPMAGSLDAIDSFVRDGHEIFFITARKCGAEERVTLKWLDKYRIPRQNIVFAGGASKTFAIREYGIDIFVEDFLGNALEIAAIGIPVLLLDASYNQGNIPQGVKRCCNWEEVKAYINKLEA